MRSLRVLACTALAVVLGGVISAQGAAAAVDDRPPVMDVLQVTSGTTYVRTVAPTAVTLALVGLRDMGEPASGVMAPTVTVTAPTGAISHVTASEIPEGGWGVSIPLPTGSVGKWTFTVAQIRDKAGNTAVGPWVARIWSGTQEKPALSASASLSKYAVDLTAASSTVDVLLAATTDTEVIRPVVAYSTAGVQGELPMTLLTGTVTSGTWRARITLPKGRGGYWSFSVALREITGWGGVKSTYTQLVALPGATSYWPSYPASGGFGEHTGDKLADPYCVSFTSPSPDVRRNQVTVLQAAKTGLWHNAGGYVGGAADMTSLAQIGDWTGDRRSDFLVRRSDNTLWIYKSTSQLILLPYRQVGWVWGGMSAITYVGALSGGSAKYVVALDKSGDMYRYTMSGTGLSGKTKIGHGWIGFTQLFSVGDFTGDGRSDIVAIRTDGTMWLYPGTTSSTLGTRRQVGNGWNTFKLAVSPGDISGDGRFDMIGLDKAGAVWAYTNTGKGGWSTRRQVSYSGTGGAYDCTLLA